MFLIKAGTVIQVQVPKESRYYHTTGWMSYTTKEDKIYEKEEVFDFIALKNGRQMPDWMAHNIEHCNRIVIQRNGSFAMVYPSQIEYLD